MKRTKQHVRIRQRPCHDILRHHLHDGLKNEYLNIKDPQILWSNLKEIYYHQKTVTLPNALSEYNSGMFRITSQLKLCSEKITNMDMSTPLPETSVTSYNEKGHYRDHTSSTGRGRGRGQWRCCGRRRGFRGNSRGRGVCFKKTHSHLRWNRKNSKAEKDKSENVTNKCYRCGAKGHWSCVYRTPKHLLDLYLQLVKQQINNVETNMVIEDGEKVADFFPTPEGN
ncbi:hypothetical protein RND81_08G091100 [Saponaria officinalis]|uniref:CCHC-type domain-containing protein n=1 Tax=Saponaria officinalis TaxID=3572 RepID=A0AAW1J5I3_SAPOF